VTDDPGASGRPVPGDPQGGAAAGSIPSGRVEVRVARPEEYGRIGDLTVAAYLGLPDGADHPDYLETLRDVAGRAGETVILVAVDDVGRVLGGVTYVSGPGPWFEGEADGEARHEAEFRALAVAPDAQGRGVGRALVEACIERARLDGRRALALYTRPSMAAAHRVYEGLGFVRMPERDWQFEPGQWLLGYRLVFDPAGPRLGTHAAVVPRPASTVVLVRDVVGGIEVLLSHRPSTMAFAPDVHVFPGGGVDPEDGDPRLAARSRIDAAQAAERLGGSCLPDEALAFHVAAIRELFEEAGVLLAERTGDGRPADQDTALPRGGLDPAAVAVARTALVRRERTFVELCEALDLDLRTDRLVPLSRWVTPPVMARRFDARFFAAALPAGAKPTLEGAELLAHAWFRPLDALAGLPGGSIRLWVPTAANLQRLAHASSFAEVADRLRSGIADPPVVEPVAPDILCLRQGSAAGVDGLATNAYIVGGRHVAVIDPGDPSEEALLALVEAVRGEGATITGVALTSPSPEHSGGAEHLREGLGVLVHAVADATTVLPIPVEPVADGEPLRVGDVRLTSLAMPGPRPGHVAYLVAASGSLICGDLLGMPGRSIPPPPDIPAWLGSIEQARALRARRLLPAHGAAVEGEAAVEAALDAVTRRLSGDR
jgi:glyoxylase-like metal-dependent hydrolase (beta-lactamase superfamily II)/ribosomal protein S18 acetylase RimI-like enzyme/8-oxo-dGTP pyrophosphatase MutT (NUDIX family)